MRRVYDLRHSFATFALRAGISTFDLSRYMGASLTMIDRHYGHLARDGREHAIHLLDELNGSEVTRWTSVDAAWTPSSATILAGQGKNLPLKQEETGSPLTDSNRRPPLYEEGACVKWSVVGIAQSGRASWWSVVSGAHLSIASSWGGQGRWEFA